MLASTMNVYVAALFIRVRSLLFVIHCEVTFLKLVTEHNVSIEQVKIKGAGWSSGGVNSPVTPLKVTSLVSSFF